MTKDIPMTRFATVSTLALFAANPALADAFNRIASFPVVSNMAEGGDMARETSSEIIAATPDGMTLVYTDSPLGVIGRIDISDPADPQPMGTIDVEGEPTSVAMAGEVALVGVNTSQSFDDPSGELRAINLAQGTVTDRCDLGGQPDAVAVAPDGSFAAVAIENERDESENGGQIPQMPAGTVALVDLSDAGLPQCDTLRTADLTGLARTAPSDPEPEYVAINGQGEVLVTLQENNHIAILDRDGNVLTDFTAGAVNLEGVDTVSDGALLFQDEESGVPREPDMAAWIDDDHFAIANEGDYEGGTRGWSIFSQSGELIHDNGTAFEHALAEIGHYPESRSGAKGVEPESATFAEYDGTPMLFIGSERGSVVGVYDVSDPAAPERLQLLPSGIGPEGFVAIPERGLLVSANEVDLVDEGARSHVMIFELQDAAPRYPHITSAGTEELIGWGALSGLAFGQDGLLRAVNDNFYAQQPTIFTIDQTRTPARITETTRVSRQGLPVDDLDMEGIVSDGQGGWWIASEGDAQETSSMLYHVGEDGEIQTEVALPDTLAGTQRRHGFEGIAMVDGALWIAVQRPWDGDPEDQAKLLRYDPADESWGGVAYPLDSVETGWVGLSEITAHDGALYIIERDNQLGQTAEVKQIARISLDALQPTGVDTELPVVEKEIVRDLIPDLTATNGYIQDKVEGLAISQDGTAWVVTDNDGVADSSGETLFWSFQVN